VRLGLRPFSVSRSRRTVRKRTGFQTIPLRRWPRTVQHPCRRPRLARAVFRASRLRLLSLRSMETPSVRVIRGRILLGLRTGLAPDRSRDLAAARSSGRRQRSWDSRYVLRSVAPRPRVTAPFFVGASNPPAVSPVARREFHWSRDSRVSATNRGALSGRGSWGLAPRSGRAVRSIGPA